MYSAADVLSIIQHDFYTWYITVPKYYTDNHAKTVYTMPAQAEYLRNLWTHYNAVHLENLRKAYQAMQTEYDPIANYDMIEEGADGRKKDKNEVKTTPTGTDTITAKQYKTGLGSTGEGDLTDKAESTQTGGRVMTSVETPTNTQSIIFDGTSKSGYHEGTEHFLKRSGNIGVTTSQQMLQSEIDLRKTDLLLDYVGTFMRQAAFYKG